MAKISPYLNFRWRQIVCKWPGENNAQCSAQAESKEEADILYNKISEGGKIEMPLVNAFWGCLLWDVC